MTNIGALFYRSSHLPRIKRLEACLIWNAHDTDVTRKRDSIILIKVD
jgi:hypothetical protein